MSRLSIITPIFNGEAYIDRYMSDLDAQTCKDFEVILVDDCSTDGSREKLERHEGKHAFKIVIKTLQKNQGPGVARNEALRHISGDFVTFIDIDDHVANDYVEKLLDVMIHNDCDLAIFDYYREGQNFSGRENVVLTSKGDEFVPKPQAFRCSHISCTKVFKTSIIKQNELHFPALYSGEDGVFVRRYIKYADKIYYSKYAGYYYQYNPKSIMHTHMKRKKVERSEEEYRRLTRSSDANIMLRQDFYDTPEIVFELWLEDLLSVIGRLYNEKAPNKWYKRYIKEKEREMPQWYQAIDKTACNLYRKCIYIAIKLKSATMIKTFLWVKRRLI